jgi:hypothetical protein
MGSSAPFYQDMTSMMPLPPSIPTAPLDPNIGGGSMRSYHSHSAQQNYPVPPYRTDTMTFDDDSSQLHQQYGGDMDPAMLEALQSFAKLNGVQQQQVLALIHKRRSVTHSTTSESSLDSRAADWQLPLATSGMVTSLSSREGPGGGNRGNAQTEKLPDVKVNHLHIAQNNIHLAVSANASAIGITPGDLYRDEATSRFNGRTRDSAPSGGADVSRLQRLFSTVTKDLRPTETQITVTHHPYLVGRFPTSEEYLFAGLALPIYSMTL